MHPRQRRRTCLHPRRPMRRRQLRRRTAKFPPPPPAKFPLLPMDKRPTPPFTPPLRLRPLMPSRRSLLSRRRRRTPLLLRLAKLPNRPMLHLLWRLVGLPRRLMHRRPPRLMPRRPPRAMPRRPPRAMLQPRLRATLRLLPRPKLRRLCHHLKARLGRPPSRSRPLRLPTVPLQQPLARRLIARPRRNPSTGELSLRHPP